nr:hypothetical protein [Providencia sp.]UNJ80157.1 hypothetical protein [Providencia sp.]
MGNLHKIIYRFYLLVSKILTASVLLTFLASSNPSDNLPNSDRISY